MKAHKRLHDFLIENGYIYKKNYIKYFSMENIFLAIDFSKPYKNKLYINFLPTVPLATTEKDDWPFYVITPLPNWCGQYLHTDGKLYINEYTFNLKDKEVYEELLIRNLTEIELALVDLNSYRKILEWIMNESELLPEKYGFVMNCQSSSYETILSGRHLYADSAHFLILKIIYSIMFNEFTIAAETIQHKELNKPYLHDLKRILNELINNKKKFRVTDFHQKFLPR